MKEGSGTFLALLLVLGSSAGPSSTLAAVIYWDPWSPGSFGSIASSPYTWTSPLDKICLDFTGSDTIHALFFGEEQTVAGVWGGLTSSAPNKSERLTGPGTLTVLTGVEPPGILMIIR